MTIKKELQAKERGITLIALVITIIILLILAGITIGLVTGDNGILAQASKAQEKTTQAQEEESIKLAIMASSIEENGYQKFTEENLQKVINEQFGDGKAKVYSNEKDTFSVIFQNKDSAYRIESNGDINKIDIAFTITNEEEYKNFIKEVNSGNSFENQYVYLLNDLDFQSEEIDIVGNFIDESNNKPFSGIFEGNNKKIYNLNINKNQDFVALFAYNKGIIRNIVLESGNITGQGRTAGITALNAGIIENCHNKGVSINLTGNAGAGIAAKSIGEIVYCSNLVDITSEAGYIGGIVGANNQGEVSKCYNIGKIEAIFDVGGIAGGNASEATIKYCYNLGNIIGNGVESQTNKETYVGGISGNSFGKIECCYNVENIRCEVSQAGGIVGTNQGSAEISNCYNIGTIEKNGNGIGNITGTINSTAKINNCYFSKEICDLEGIGVIFGSPTTIETIEKTISYMKTSSFVNDLNKDEEAFVMDTEINNGYPIFKWQVE